MGCTLAPPGKYYWTVDVQQRCGIFVKLLSSHLLLKFFNFPSLSVLMVMTKRRWCEEVTMRLDWEASLLVNQQINHAWCSLPWDVHTVTTKFSELLRVLHSWFHPSADRHIAESLLMQNGEEGSYLLRPSKNDGNYSLSVRYSLCLLLCCHSFILHCY